MARERHREDAAAWPVVLSSVLLSGAVAAAVAAAVVRFAAEPAPAVVSVRLGELTAAWAVKAAASDAPRDTAAADARRWAAALETALAHVAERRGAVLLPARAVAAGAPDATAHVEAVLAGILARGPAEGDAPPPGEAR